MHCGRRPLASVVIGGLVSSTLLTLFLLPLLDDWILQEREYELRSVLSNRGAEAAGK
jgi:hypothetical protein